jgi:hypothetical protein
MRVTARLALPVFPAFFAGSTIATGATIVARPASPFLLAPLLAGPAILP